MRREKIFEKYTLNNGIEIKNRLVVTPMTLFVANQDGTFSEKDFNFMKKRGENWVLWKEKHRHFIWLRRWQRRWMSRPNISRTEGLTTNTTKC